MKFPIPIEDFEHVALDPKELELSEEKKEQLQKNIQLARDAIVFFTGLAGAKGLGGHTGGAYDIVPEALIVEGLKKAGAKIHPFTFDEAGHRVALQYFLAAVNNDKGLSVSDLLHYREYDSGLPGHPENDEKLGIDFSSGRLGHMWAHVNGVSEQNPDKHVVMFGSDGSQQEGNDAEAARYCAANGLKVVLVIDDNDVTIEDKPSNYLKGFSVEKTLQGHGLNTDTGDGEDLGELYKRIVSALYSSEPIALINKRKMAVGIEGVEDTTKGHDCIAKDAAINYLKQKGYDDAVKIIEEAKKVASAATYEGSSEEKAANRSVFGEVVVDILTKKSEKEQSKNLVVSNDLGGSCGLNKIGAAFSDIYRKAGIMERGNFLLAAGFGSKKGYQGIYATFSAFLEMVVSEITMSKLNEANVLAHFSHSGVDDMADNTCHFGINNFFAAGGFEHQNKLYFPADALQMRSIVEKIFDEQGLRFVFSTRSKVPFILNEKGEKFFENYKFTGKDEVIREGKGYIVSYGDMLYRSLSAAEQLKKEGVDVGLINKPVLSDIDEEMMGKLGSADFVLVVESQSAFTGLGSKMGSWLLERGHSPKYAHIGTTKYGRGGLSEQVEYQGLDSESIKKKVKELL